VSNWYEFGYLFDQEIRADTYDQGTAPAVDSKAFQAHGPAVSVGKGGRAYNAHSYPTKVPPEAIEPFLLHYTKPGDTVLDPFCGSGMTGLAARRTGRHAVLNDLSTLALHLAYNHTEPCDPGALTTAWSAILERLAPDALRLYGVDCDSCDTTGTIRYTIWSDVYACPSCRGDVPLWKSGLDRTKGTVSRSLSCPTCGCGLKKSADARVRIEPAWIAYSCACTSGLRERDLSEAERHKALSWPRPADKYYPKHPLDKSREMYKRSALHLQQIETVADFYTGRNLTALATLWEEIGRVADPRVRRALSFAFTNTAWHGTRMRRFNARGGHRPLTGTLYIPQLSSEANVFEVFGNKVDHLSRFYAEVHEAGATTSVHLHNGSATELSWVKDASIDYVFTDPPFGSNIFYADCNLIAEAWLGTVTDPSLEAVVNRSRGADEGGKTLQDYQALLEQAFSEMYRVLKPGHWATVVFQSSDGDVWKAIEHAAEAAGFEVHGANMLDKIQQSMKGYKGRSGAENVASFDIMLHLRRQDGEIPLARHVLDDQQLRELALATVGDHLALAGHSDPGERTLPYLYSLVVRKLLTSGRSVSGFTMEALRSYLRDLADEQGGRWYLRPTDGQKLRPGAA
jgi:DNA modification methylase